MKDLMARMIDKMINLLDDKEDEADQVTMGRFVTNVESFDDFPSEVLVERPPEEPEK